MRRRRPGPGANTVRSPPVTRVSVGDVPTVVLGLVGELLPGRRATAQISVGVAAFQPLEIVVGSAVAFTHERDANILARDDAWRLRHVTVDQPPQPLAQLVDGGLVPAAAGHDDVLALVAGQDAEAVIAVAQLADSVHGGTVALVDTDSGRGQGELVAVGIDEHHDCFHLLLLTGKAADCGTLWPDRYITG